MTYQTIIRFFMWNTIINGGILIFWTLVFMLSADFIYEIHSNMFFITRNDFNTLIYALVGLFKILFIILNVTPFITLLLIKQRMSVQKDR